MSNRGLAITLFVVFLVVFVYEMETLKSSRSQVEHNVAPQPQSNRNDNLQAATALVVANQLAFLGEVTRMVVGKLYPDLKDDLHYADFKISVSNRRSTAGVLRFDSLRLEYKDDYDKLRERYEAEHPGQKVTD